MYLTENKRLKMSCYATLSQMNRAWAECTDKQAVGGKYQLLYFLPISLRENDDFF